VSPTLQAAMARALYGESDSHLESARLAAERILRSLRSDPEVLTAMAEALRVAFRVSGAAVQDGIWNDITNDALTALLGEPSLTPIPSHPAAATPEHVHVVGDDIVEKEAKS